MILSLDELPDIDCRSPAYANMEILLGVVAVAGFIATVVGVYIGYLQLRRMPIDLENDSELLSRVEVEGTKNEVGQTHLEIRFIEPECLVDCSEVSDNGLIVHTPVIDLNRFKFRWKTQGIEKFLKSTIAVINQSPETIFVSSVRCQIIRSSFSLNSHIHSSVMIYPDPSFLITEASTSQPAIIEPWHQINHGEKILWDLSLDLQVVPPFSSGESHIDKVLIELSCDTGRFVGSLDFSDKALKWKCLEN